MQLMILSDIHGTMDFLPQVIKPMAEADLVVVAGDITTFGDAEKSRSVIESLASVNPRILAVSGNCDLADMDPYLAERGMGLHATCQQVDGIDFMGVSGSLPSPGSTPNELGESRFLQHLEKALKQREPGSRPLVLVSHQPAYGTSLDRAGGGGHTGSTALRDFIDRERPILAVSGHIHESSGTDRLDDCTLVNPGPFKFGDYACAEITNGSVSVHCHQV
ncbi:metallophosphoesterase [Planctomycetota bacterium]